MNTGLSDSVVWITGASGGIGLALADAFAAEGARLVLQASTRATPLEQWASERGLGARVLAVAADVTDAVAMEGVVDRARTGFGRIDVCVTSAGVWPPDDVPLHQMPVERVRRVIDVNLLGTMWAARAFLGGLAATGPRDDGRGASLCFIGSTAGRFGEARHAEYASSKSALHGLMRSLKNEIVRLDPYGRVNMVEPGWTVTPMASKSLEEPGTVERVLATTPLQQLARPEDVARAVVYLCGPATARHVSGEVVTIAGGMEGRTQWSAADVDVDRVRLRLERE